MSEEESAKRLWENKTPYSIRGKFLGLQSHEYTILFQLEDGMNFEISATKLFEDTPDTLKLKELGYDVRVSDLTIDKIEKIMGYSPSLLQE